MMIAIMVPALGVARQHARFVQDMTNLRQLHQAAFMYADDFDGSSPPADTWPDALAPYLADDTAFVSSFSPEDGLAYALNAKLANRDTLDVPLPELTVLFFEAAFGSDHSGGPELMPDEPRGPMGFLILFLDGHSEAVSKDDLEDLIWDPE